VHHLKKAHKNACKYHIHTEGRSVGGWIFFVFDLPLTILLYLTALPPNKDNYCRKQALVWCVLGPGIFFPLKDSAAFIHTAFQSGTDIPLWLYVSLPLSILLLIIFWLNLGHDFPESKWGSFFTITALLVGLNLTKITVSVLINMLGLVGVLFNLPKTYLGLTILAVGNALPDAFTTMALVKSGSATLAISGGYAGQLFGLLIGFGISMLKLTLSKGGQKFTLFNPELFEQNFLNILVVSTCG
jgi:hypothetical protein